ncbi:myrosinase 1-like [Pieris brassicae]|uniref:myrosinase 1-like n=1 Tax=Pieris brassicae TaxID=7116 RepID=UPI001E65FDDF|nr:myrosinase 1-like [Pieris brassicae]
MYPLSVVLSLLVAACAAERKFPPGFKFGAATAAYQVEGAWNVSDKSPSIWDTFTHDNTDFIVDKSNGDVACDSYHLWEADIAVAKDLGLHFYRFSISWPRLLPNGHSNYVSEDGKRYYNNLINGLIANGIEPVVTLYHWDLPQKLQDLGGWTNPELAILFEDYAKVAFGLFGDRVKTWITFNEPIIICDVAYEAGRLAPGIALPGIGNYMCAKVVMLAHARAYRLYDTKFRPQYQGKVGLTNQQLWCEPKNSDEEENAELIRNVFALFAYPIYSKTGGWPPSVEKRIAETSEKEGYSRSRLPTFTQEEIEFIKGTYDFYGLNYYTSRTVETAQPGEKLSWPVSGSWEFGLALSTDPSWKAGHAWLISYPPGIRRQLHWLKEKFGDIEFQILENGYATSEPVMYDQGRVNYYRDHLEQVLLAINEDKVNVTAYTAWSLIDNYEWSSGYTSRFGLVNIDFNDPNRKRTLRASAHYYAAVINSHSLDLPHH